MINFSKVSSIFRIIILLSLCCQVQQVRCQIKPMGQKGKVRAVVIGISDYQNEHIPDLLFADADAKAFAEFLKSPAGGNLPEDQVKLLTNSQATQGQMNAELTWLLEESKEGDQALIFFSGHGDMETQTMMNLGFLLTYNSPASAYMSGGAFPIYFLQSIIQTLSVQKGVQVIMVADACHSGKLAGDANNGAQATASVLASQFAKEAKILSCQSNEYSLEGREWGGGHGVFTYYLIDGLTGLADANNDESVSLLEIERYLQDQVSAAAAPKSQIPIVIGNKGMVAAKVDPPMLAALRSRRQSEASLGAIASVGSKGMLHADDQDTATMALYRRFKDALAGNKLLSPATDAAYPIYMEIKDRPAIAPYRQDMRRNLAAALQDEAQKAINDYLEANPVELRKRWSYDDRYQQFPEYLDKAAELLGPDHFMYANLKARELYFSGLNLRLKGEQEKKSELFDEAVAIQENVLKLDSTAAYAMNELGLLARRKGDYSGSVEYFQDALSLSPTWVLAQTNLCGSFTNLGKNDMAEKACLKALSTDSTFALAYYNLGIAQMGLSNARAAIGSFRQSVKFDSLYPLAWSRLGDALYSTDQKEDAVNMWKESTKIDPAFTLAYNNIAVVSEELGRTEEALMFYKKVTELAPDDPDAYLDIAKLELNSGNITASENALTTHLRLKPDSPDAFFTLSRLKTRQHQSDAALQAFRTALEKGFRDIKSIEDDPAMKQQLEKQGFRDLMKKYFPEKD